ncbi:MAG TPA: hypothetical protein VHK91_04880 [Flavisolibacter sp.]|nr:hypothetical protein [Flavisolibacter sp.]
MKRLPLKYHFVRGRIGKLFVIKRYKGGVVVMTRYPDMTNIIASEKQKIQRRLFKQAVKYAKEIFSNPNKKAEKKKELRRPRRLFQALMKEWFRKKASKDYANRRRLRIWKTNIELNKGKLTIVGQIENYQNCLPKLQEELLLHSTDRHCERSEAIPRITRSV